MSKLDKILDDWLVHDSGCNFSLYNEPCDCIQSKVKVSVSREIKALMLELIGENIPMEDSQVSAYKDELRENVNNL